jgi:dTDP-glucose pyrophosphorylase/predicted transcriptional regulator
MVRYRRRFEIIADILSAALKGAKKTRIMYVANLSYELLEKYLAETIRMGFIRLNNSDYEVTESGLAFLEKYNGYSGRYSGISRMLQGMASEREALNRMCQPQDNDFLKRGDSRFKGSERQSRGQIKGAILAAGEGARIKNITYGAIPKELLPIASVPTIRFPIESLKLVGVKEISIVISANGKHDIIQGLRSGKKLGVNINYVVQDADDGEPRGIGKAIFSVKGWVGQDDFLVACGDTILCDLSSKTPFDCLSSLLKVHLTKDPLATVFLYPTKTDPSRFGVAKFQELQNDSGTPYGQVERLIEKPSRNVAKTLTYNGFNYVIAGYYAFKPRIFSYIEKTKPDPRNEVQITDALILAIENGERVFGVVHGKQRDKQMFPYEYWDVGIPEAYKEANRKLLSVDVEGILT